MTWLPQGSAEKWAPGDLATVPSWLPRDPDNWHGRHLQRAERRADTLFDEYERRVNFATMSNERVDDLYSPYMHAARACQTIACAIGMHTRHPV